MSLPAVDQETFLIVRETTLKYTRDALVAREYTSIRPGGGLGTNAWPLPPIPLVIHEISADASPNMVHTRIAISTNE